MNNTTAQTIEEIRRFRSRYREEAKRWLSALEPAAKTAADIFTQSDMYIILAAYEITPWPAIEEAILADDPENYDMGSEYGEALQSVLSRCLEYFADGCDDYCGVLFDDIYSALEMSLGDNRYWAVKSIAERVASLSADETVGLVSMLEVIRAMPHGIRGYPGRWTPRSLLGMLDRCDHYTPWRTEDSSSGDCIDFETGGIIELDED